MSASRGLVEWLAGGARASSGQRALVVGQGLREDADLVARLGFRVTTFDLATPAPREYRRAFALVVAPYAMERLPPGARAESVLALADLVASGGTLLVLANAREEAGEEGRADRWNLSGPPWALAASELEPLERAGLELVRFEDYAEPREGERRFRAEYRRAPSTAS
jgi:hypothetical protein